MKIQKHIFTQSQGMFQRAAELIALWSEQTIRLSGFFTLVLSGGQTPRTLYDLLSGTSYRNRIDWKKVHLFWGDERFVSRDSPLSNYRMAFDSLISKIPIPHENIHPIPGRVEADSPEHSAILYEENIKAFFHSAIGDAGIPAFDAILLGIGNDGHTASLYPGSRALEETRRLVIPVEAPPDAPVKQRITLSLPAINNASNVMFLVSGAGKARILKKIITESEEENATYPASMVKPQKGLHLMTDIDVVTDIDEY